jgi:hypothetical protein
MKVAIIVLIILFAKPYSANAQDSTRLTRIEYVIGASLAFSLIDYVGFNIDVRQHHHSEWMYHGIQSALQAAITYFLYETCGLKSALAFNLIWWSWADDLGYYGWAYALNPPTGWENRSFNGLQNHEITWAYWTPIGLMRPSRVNIARDAVIAQSIIGVSLSIPLLW